MGAARFRIGGRWRDAVGSAITRRLMDLDDLLLRYFGAADLDAVDAGALADGAERIRIALGTERDAGRRFALWTLLHALGDAPDPALAFKNPAERRAAEEYARAADRLGGT